jgi:hypothetical protein
MNKPCKVGVYAPGDIATVFTGMRNTTTALPQRSSRTSSVLAHRRYKRVE